MTRARIFLCLCLGFLLGVGVGSVSAPAAQWWLVAAAVSIAACAVGGAVQARPGVLAILVMLMGVCGGGVRIQSVLAQESRMTAYVGTKQDFEGVIVADPDVRQTSQLLTVQPDGFSERVLVTTTLTSTFLYGDRVWVRGRVGVPEPFNGFDYPGFLARAQIYTVIKYPKVITLHGGEGNAAMRVLLSVKRWVVDTVHARLPGENGDLLLGMLIGHKRGLPADALQDFVRTGTSHILAVSGFNVSVFVVWLSGLAAWVGRRRQLVLSAVCVLCFAVISGLSAAVIRATCMGLLLLLSTGFGRVYIPSVAVVTAAACMVLQNPRILYWDVGFQLSAAATLGIVWGMDIVAALSERFPRSGLFLKLAGVTLCAIVATTPIALWHFGQLSTVALVANMAVLPVVEFTMALGMLALLPVVGSGFAYVAGQVLTVVRWVIEQLASLPYASVAVSLSGPAAVVCLIVVLGLLWIGSQDGAPVRQYMTSRWRMWYNVPSAVEKTVQNTNNY